MPGSEDTLQYISLFQNNVGNCLAVRKAQWRDDPYTCKNGIMKIIIIMKKKQHPSPKQEERSLKVINLYLNNDYQQLGKVWEEVQREIG